MSESTSYLTAEEVQAVQHLHKRTPYVIASVTRSYYSVARHYGSTTLNGCHYTYIKEHDELVRDDVLAIVKRMRRAAEKAAPAQPQSTLPSVGEA